MSGHESTDHLVLAVEIADEAARCDVEDSFQQVAIGDATWFDTSIYTEVGCDFAVVGRSLRYLRARGEQANGFRIVRHPAFPHLVRFEEVAA